MPAAPPCPAPPLSLQLLPQSIAYIGANEEAGGGNRISEEQIKNYLEKTLGDAPRPPWGVSRSQHGPLLSTARYSAQPAARSAAALLPPAVHCASGRLRHLRKVTLPRLGALPVLLHDQPPARPLPALRSTSHLLPACPQVPNGWYSYVSELFSWALGRPVDEESTKKCAKREPGRR